jgi:hypothetical protein
MKQNDFHLIDKMYVAFSWIYDFLKPWYIIDTQW